MHPTVNRREFLTTSACVATGAAVALSLPVHAAEERLKKAVIIGKPTEDNLKPLKDAGFDGVETNAVVSPEEATKSKRAADKVGLKIHSVLRGWMQFNSDKPEQVQGSIDKTAAALKAAQAYGADAILLVPCRIGGMAMPAPWEFKLEFDPKTGHLTSVAEGDNEKYEDYIAAHDKAWDTSLAAIRKLIPVAEETGVVIAVENVWNNLFVKPPLFAHFIDAFDSKWVQAYFDIGNHIKYAPAEEWVQVLGKRIAKLHVKDFKLNEDGHGGKFVNLRDGSANYPAVIEGLKKAGYTGWLTIEGSGKLSKEEQSKRLDLIIAGK